MLMGNQVSLRNVSGPLPGCSADTGTSEELSLLWSVGGSRLAYKEQQSGFICTEQRKCETPDRKPGFYTVSDRL